MITENYKKWPHFEKDDIDAVSEVMASGKINRWTGDKNILFEKAMCEFTGVKYAIAVSNGTTALELALEGLGVGAGDEVITTCRTFMASASCIVMRGATPIVADVDLNSQNILPSEIEKLATPKTKAVIAVHHMGFPCDMDAIMAVAASSIFMLLRIARRRTARSTKAKASAQSAMSEHGRFVRTKL